ncbi:MAG: hypothetical protein AB7I35_12420 [Ramlibacter sp.]|nr:hypothetical protein [Ramlibacter sp.]
MKTLITAALLLTLPGLLLAQTDTKPAKKAPHKLAPSAQKAVEEVTPIDEEPDVQLSDADRAVAAQVHTGNIPCELDATVIITESRRHKGFFSVITRGHRFYMHPVESRTGAIRLEDPKRGAMWLQLGNKSMLMSQKLGQRLADDCMNPAQQAVNEALKKNPLPSLLEPLPAASAAAGAQSASPSRTPTN